LRATEFVDSYIDAWNHHDASLVAEHLSSDGTYCDVPDNEQHSRDELVKYLLAFFALNDHSYSLLGEVLTGKNSIAFQYGMSLQGDKSETYFGAEFVTLDGAEAIKILDYYDIPGIASPVTQAHMGKYTKSGLSPSQIENYKQRLTTLMQYEKVYRRPDLTLPKLATLVDCSVNHLSQVINSGIGMSFFDYLNQHRVEYAKQLLSKQANQHQSILNIAFTVGFNSNSSFYTAFKKASGKTPAQYRQSRKHDEL
jgi:AraC-like DNA-binding protein